LIKGLRLYKINFLKALVVVSAIAGKNLPQRAKRISVNTRGFSVRSVFSVAKMAQTMITALLKHGRKEVP